MLEINGNGQRHSKAHNNRVSTVCSVVATGELRVREKMTGDDDAGCVG